MTKPHFSYPAVLLVISAMLQCKLGIGQNAIYPIAEWVKKLDAHNDLLNRSLQEIIDALNGKDSTVVFPVLNQMEKQGASAGIYFKTRFLCLKAWETYNVYIPFNFRSRKEQVKQLFAEAQRDAYESGDDYLVTFTSWQYGSTMFAYGEIELAAMYCLNSVELHDKLYDRNDWFHYQLLGEILFQTREYEQCIAYNRKAVANWNYANANSDYYMMKCLTAIALSWHKLGRYDSALTNYKKSLQFAVKTDDKVWQGIISGDMGQVFFLCKKYDSAKLLLDFDYHTNKQARYFDIAANSLQWMARINLLEGKKDSALLRVREALVLLQTIPNANYLQDTYYTAAETYRALGVNDSAYRYSDLYQVLHDSLEKLVVLSSTEEARIKLRDEKNRQSIRNLQNEKKEQEQQRNFIIAGILFLAAVAILLVNAKRLQLKYKQELTLEQKRAAESEMIAAKEQVKMFTENIIQKTSLIEKLEQQVKDKELSGEQQQLIAELRNNTILTDEDWDMFQINFEKVYPAFFLKLKDKVADITQSEQRLAALTRLHLSTKQMASILGISIDGVHKTRQRLRHRLNSLSEIKLEEFIAAL